VFRRATRRGQHRVATALRMAATSLWRGKTYLGARSALCEPDEVHQKPSLR
jgi:hypothetical protein